MLVAVSNVLSVTHPTDDLKLWCKNNLMLPNPEYAKKVRMGLWVGKTPKLISLYEIHGDEWVLPFGVLRMLPKKVSDEAIFIGEFKTPVEIDYNTIVPLYDYQEQAVQAMISARCGILQSAAGSGKTQMGIALATKLKRRTLWLCHTIDLVNQSKERAERYIDQSLIGTIAEGKVNLGIGITFATIQTMSRLDLSKYRDYWDCIITDEVHRVSGSPTSVTQYYKVLNSLSARHKYGLSATVYRSDGMIEATYALVGNIAYRVPDSAVASKIMRVGICTISTGVGVDQSFLNTDGTLNYTKLITYLIENEDRNRLIANCIERRPSLILSDRLRHLEHIMKLLPVDMRNDAVMISGKMVNKTGKERREKALDDMRTGRKKYLFATYSLAKEGLDVPCLERLYLATPQKDYAVIIQSLGRIARTCPNKTDAIAYDFVDEVGYLVKSYKKRCAIYRKDGCYFVDGGNKP